MTLASQPAPKLKPKRSIGSLLLKVFGALIVIIAAIIALVLWLTSDLVDAGNSFFAKLREGDQKGAYELTTPGFRQSASPERFAAFVKQYQFEKAQAPSWSNRSIQGSGDNARGTLKGSLKDGGGNTQTLEVRLSKVQGKWRVQHVDVEIAGLQGGQASSADKRIPGESDLVRLVHESNLIFARAARERSMQAFHAHIAERFRAKYGVADLDKAFAAMMNPDVNLVAIENFTPAFDAPPAPDGADVFKISGVY